jgi:hypothetical protein
VAGGRAYPLPFTPPASPQLVGEPEKALDQLEPLLKMPYYLSPGWLKIDPTFALLRGNARFERLVAGGEPHSSGRGVAELGQRLCPLT